MVTAIISKKGGVGKTTTAVGLSAALAGIGKRVLLVDLDSQASASLSVGVDRASLAPSIADVLLRSAPALSARRATQVAGLDLITASADLVSLDAEVGIANNRHALLAERLESLAAGYDFVILDCPPSLSLISIMALHFAAQFVVPVVPEYLASVGVDNLLRSVERLVLLGGRRTRCLGLLLNMVDYRTRTHRDVVEQLRRRYGDLVFAVEVRTNIRLAQAPAHGQTIFEFDPKAVGAKAMRLAAAEFLMRTRSVSEDAAPEPATGPLPMRPVGLRPRRQDGGSKVEIQRAG